MKIISEIMSHYKKISLSYEEEEMEGLKLKEKQLKMMGI